MHQINQNQIGPVETNPRGGRFYEFRENLAIALGRKKAGSTQSGGHPFDLELTCLPPGTTNRPYHAHPVQRELFVVLSGRGRLQTPEGEFEIGPDDYFIHPSGQPHQIWNTGTDDLVFYVIADNLPDDIIGFLEFQKLAYQAVGQRKLTSENF